MIHFDTSFLIDLSREKRRDAVGPTRVFLGRLPPNQPSGVSVHAVCELYAGVAMSAQPEDEEQRVRNLISNLSVVLPDADFAPTYGRLLAGLRRRGVTVATMDLLIGTAAVCASAPLVTGNPKHFTAIEGLEVMSYRDSR